MNLTSFTRLSGNAMTRSVAAALLAGFTLSACSATDSNHPLRAGASAVGFATTVGQPKDFVLARRSNQELAYVPIGRGGIERPVQPRSVDGLRELERDLDSTRDRSEAFARRQLPRGAYGAALPSVARPVRPTATSADGARPTAGAPESYPVSPNRARQLRENARNAQ